MNMGALILLACDITNAELWSIIMEQFLLIHRKIQ